MDRGYPCVGEVEALEGIRWLCMGNCQNYLYRHAGVSLSLAGLCSML